MHPLSEDFSQLKDTEIEDRIQDLTKKYFMTNSQMLRNQISMFLDLYKAEIEGRRAKMWKEQYQKRDTDLDSLININ